MTVTRREARVRPAGMPRDPNDDRRTTKEYSPARKDVSRKRSIISGCSTRETTPPRKYFAHVRAVPNLENVSSFFHTNTVNTAKLVLLAPRRGVPSRGLLAMMVSIAARTLALAFSLAPSRSRFLARAVSAYIYTSPFIRAPPPHSPSHASGLGLVADSVRSTTGVAPYMNTPSTYVSASSSPGS